MKQLKWLFIVALTAIGAFAIVYVVDKAAFANFGSIRPVKDASKFFKNLDALSASCKAENKSLVLVIHSYDDGRAQARCSDQLFAQTWDVSMFLP
ncbi:hypothetical protein [Sulfurospirillum multivorans]|nr:hypothetical protein [Sulfurospirillum multivorans]QEH06584.1 putative membrane protein [Sulfurospirillum multivorans]